MRAVDDSRSGRPAVFLDRDGVLIESTTIDGVPQSEHNLDSVHLIDGVAEACDRLHRAGVLLIVVTNQPDIARGKVTHAAVDNVHRWLGCQLALDAILTCPHDDHDRCQCRKPRPGLILDGLARFQADPDRSAMVGDRWRDIAAGRAAQVATVFVDRHLPEPQPTEPGLTVGALVDAVPFLLARALADDRAVPRTRP